MCIAPAALSAVIDQQVDLAIVAILSRDIRLVRVVMAGLTFSFVEQRSQYVQSDALSDFAA
jgi:hypothetical protein